MIERPYGVETHCDSPLSRKRISGHWRPIRGRFQPRHAAHPGSSPDRRCVFRETQVLQSSRHLSDDSAARQSVNDRTGDVAVFSATAEAGTPEGLSQVVLRRSYDTRARWDNGRGSGTLYSHRGWHEPSSAVAVLHALEALDARGGRALVDRTGKRSRDLLRVVCSTLRVVAYEELGSGD